MMNRAFFFALFMAFFQACQFPHAMLNDGKSHDAYLNSALSNYQSKNARRKAKATQEIPILFGTANQKDILEADSLIQKGKAADWPRVNALYRKIRDRQNKTRPTLDQEMLQNFIAAGTYIEQIEAVEMASREKAASFLYQCALDLISTAEQEDLPIMARQAYAMLTDLKKYYFEHWEDADAYLERARAAGVAHVLLEPHQNNSFLDAEFFWTYARLNAKGLSNEWYQYYTQEQDAPKIHYKARLTMLNLHISSENRSETIQEEQKVIETGTRAVRTNDSLSRIVRYEPILETVRGTVHSIVVTREAEVSIKMEVENAKTGRTLHQFILNEDYRFEESCKRISGDKRAVSDIIIECFADPGAPSLFRMIEHLSEDMHHRVLDELKMKI
jgi:hypothetical protein